MKKSNIKYILWIIIFFLIFILFNSWQNEKLIKNNTEKNNISNNINNDKNTYTNISTKKEKKTEINVETNLISGKINLNGGNISSLSLKKYPIDINNKNVGIKLLNDVTKELYFSQINFINKNNNNNNLIYKTNKNEYKLEKNQDKIIINLKHSISNDLIINKIYIFKNYSYEIEINFYITNLSQKTIAGRIFGCIGREINDKKSEWFTSKEYKSAAIYTDKKIYKKLSFNDIANKNYITTLNGGWIAQTDNYFLTTSIPDSKNKYIYSAEKKDNVYILKYINDSELIIFPNQCKCINTILYVGPKIKDNLNKLHKGLDLSIDYGIFWPISISIFLLLSKIYNILNNWGIAIITITILIKLLFFNLSAISYKSLGHMKKLQPRLDLLKERYKDKKKEFSQAVLELYKTEKVNPLSGCLPILIQIPVFISLYYVLLESVELRHAPFILWLNDLSSKDNYYILPIIMCITMFIQQKLNPPIQDPLQQKIMLFMPFIFLLIFLQFPSGLVLYWVINNILSIIQQWIITKNL